MSQAVSDVPFDPVAMAYLTDEAWSNVVNPKQSAILKLVPVPHSKSRGFHPFQQGKMMFELPPGRHQWYCQSHGCSAQIHGSGRAKVLDAPRMGAPPGHLLRWI